VRLARDALAQLLQDAGLADARLADELDDLPLARGGQPPALEQERDLVLASGERCQGGVAAVPRLEPTLGPALAGHAEGPHRDVEAAHALRRDLHHVERAPEEAIGELGDDDGARLGERLEPRGQIRGLADHGLLARGALADQVADDDEAGGDPDPHREALPLHDGQDGNGVSDGEAGPHGALGIVLVGTRVAEVGQHAVAHELGDVALEARDLPGDRVLVVAQDLAHALGVEPARQLGGAHEIDEHHRELPALRAGHRRSVLPRDRTYGRQLGWRRDRTRLVEGGDGIEYLATVANERHPEILEIVRGQGPERLGLDLVFGKGRGITLQA
jgi:hypothetical protein